MTKGRVTPTQLSLLGFIAVLLLAWICYRPALSGAFQLDDADNLSGLAAVEDTASAANFILSGTAGPSGRPLALLSFVMQADEWEQGAEAFLRINVLIHLLNAMLLAACFYQLSLLQKTERQKAAIIAAVAASMWVVMPLLASASLHVVQRMTTLSASFTLLGLFGYLFWRCAIEDKPRRAIIGMSASLVIGTGLATLVKEIGLLLPLYVLVLEATVLEKPRGIEQRQWRTWQSVFLALPVVIVLAYLSTRIVYPDWVAGRRGFTAGERLMTEAQILWTYVQKAVFAVPAKLGVYQTMPALNRSLLEPLTMLSSLAWLLLFTLSIIWRRRYPLAALAVLWFLGGHIVESTFVPLELYFEHRNYLPIAGPIFALVAFLALGTDTHRKILAVLAPLYIVVSAFSLYGFASLSGEPSTSSRYWATKYPDSVRAVTTMATYQLTEEGPVRTLDTLDRFVNQYPQHAYLRIQELNLRCMFMPQQDHAPVISELRRELANVEFTYTAGKMLSQLFTTVTATNCNGIDLEIVAELAGLLRDNPRYASVPGYNHFHHKLLAGVARQRGDFEETIDELQRAISYQGSAELNMMMVTTLGGAGDFDAARKIILEAWDQGPRNPLARIAWRRELENLGAYIDELERYSEGVE